MPFGFYYFMQYSVNHLPRHLVRAGADSLIDYSVESLTENVSRVI